MADSKGVQLTAADEAGRRHGLATLAQLGHRANQPGPGEPADPDGPSVAACTILDWPDFPVRGVMVDVSRDRVPTVATLVGLAGQLAGWKLNHLELSMEHTFASVGHETAWGAADPYTAGDLAELDLACRDRGVELVGNQNSLGHFERWLRHDRYRALAIAPEGFDWLFGIRRPPLTLDPAKPGAFELVADILGQLAPLLDNRPFHVGMDEPWELPAERRGEWLGWLRRLKALPALAGRETLVWGDVPAGDPGLLAGFPEGVTVCEWGYEEGHPFEERLDRLAGAGIPRWVAPGTSSWLSVTGRIENMLANVREAAQSGLAHDAGGLLMTDWGDMGHHQPRPVSEPGFAVAAAMSWCLEANRGLDLDSLAVLLDAFAFDDPAGELGGALVTLGRVHRMVTPRPFNSSALVQHLLLPQWRVGAGFTTGLRVEELEAVEEALAGAVAALGRARPGRADGQLVLEELRAASAWISLGCRDARLRLAGDGSLGSIGPEDRQGLVTEVEALAAEHGRLWTARDRPGGLPDSLAWLDHLRDTYRTGTADRAWFGP